MFIFFFVGNPFYHFEHFIHSFGDRMLAVVEYDDILLEFGRKIDSRLCVDILRVQSHTERVIDGENVIFIVLPPVLDPGYVGRGPIFGLQLYYLIHLIIQCWVYYKQQQMQKESKHKIIHSISYNSDSSLLAIATNVGFKIYSTNPTTLKQQRDFGAPIQICEVIDRSNLIGLVGFKQTPFAPPHKLAIFDDKTQRIIADMSFKSNIMQVKIRQGKIVVALHNKAYVINLFNIEIEHIIETFKFEENQKYNIISLSNDPKNFILAAPGTENGQVLLVYFNKLTQRRIKAHQSILSALEVSQDGQKLVTTSEKGIQVRIFDTRTGQMIQEVRRGNQFANIYSLVLSRKADWLAVSSDSCNIHIFAIKSTEAEKQRYYEKGQGEQKKNPKSMFYFMKKIFPHFDAEYSYCHHKIEEYNPQLQSILSFMPDDSLMMMSNMGLMQRVSLNLSGGKCQLQQKKYLVEVKQYEGRQYNYKLEIIYKGEDNFKMIGQKKQFYQTKKLQSSIKIQYLGSLIDLGSTWEQICTSLSTHFHSLDPRAEAAWKLCLIDKIQDEIEIPESVKMGVAREYYKVMKKQETKESIG